VSYKINLHFPHASHTVQMPAVPRRGEIVEWGSPGESNGSWHVTEVAFSAYSDQEGSINLTLDSTDEDPKETK
jgi:hypothetical protein